MEMDHSITKQDKIILLALGLASLAIIVTLFGTIIFGLREGTFIIDGSGSGPADEIGVILDDKAMVIEVAAGSEAEKEGLKVGDKIQGVDGVALDTAAKVNKAIQDKLEARQKDKYDTKALKLLPILVERNGVKSTININVAAPANSKPGPTPTRNSQQIPSRD